MRRSNFILQEAQGSGDSSLDYDDLEDDADHGRYNEERHRIVARNMARLGEQLHALVIEDEDGMVHLEHADPPSSRSASGRSTPTQQAARGRNDRHKYRTRRDILSGPGHLSKQDDVLRAMADEQAAKKRKQNQAVKPKLIKDEYWPKSNEEWLDRYANKRDETLRFLATTMRAYASHLHIPVDTKGNLQVLYDITRVVELVGQLPDAIDPQQPRLARELSNLGERIWNYYAGELCKGNKATDALLNVNKHNWWDLWMLIRFLIVSNYPCHARFLEWYNSFTLGSLLGNSNPDFEFGQLRPYLLHSHANAFSSAYWDVSSANNVDTTLEEPIVTPLPYLTMRPMASFLEPWLTKRVSQLTIGQLSRILIHIHSNFMSILWRPSSEVLILLLLHHCQMFIFGTAPNNLYDDPTLYDEVSPGQFTAAYVFRRRIGEVIMAPHLSLIYTYYNLLYQVNRPRKKSPLLGNQYLPQGRFDSLTGTPSFMPTQREQAQIEELILNAYRTNEFEVVPGNVLDSRSIWVQYRSILRGSSLIPGDITLHSQDSHSLKQDPFNVMSSRRPGMSKVLAVLSIQRAAPEWLCNFLRTGQWPRGQSDLSQIGNHAYAMLLYGIMRSLELSRETRDEREASESATAVADALRTRLLSPTVSNSQMTQIDAALFNSAREVLQTKSAAAQPPREVGDDDVIMEESVDDENANYINNQLEFQPSTGNWWFVAQDRLNGLPLRPNSFDWPDKKHPIPRIVTIRSEHWVCVRDNSFQLHTPFILEALKATACYTAYRHPHKYTQVLDPLLVHIFKDSLAAFAKAALTPAQ